MPKRTKTGKWRARNGRTYTTRRAATKADRQGRTSRTSNRNRKRKHKRLMRGKRRR